MLAARIKALRAFKTLEHLRSLGEAAPSIEGGLSCGGAVQAVKLPGLLSQPVLKASSMWSGAEGFAGSVRDNASDASP